MQRPKLDDVRVEQRVAREESKPLVLRAPLRGHLAGGLAACRLQLGGANPSEERHLLELRWAHAVVFNDVVDANNLSRRVRHDLRRCVVRGFVGLAVGVDDVAFVAFARRFVVGSSGRPRLWIEPPHDSPSIHDSERVAVRVP